MAAVYYTVHVPDSAVQRDSPSAVVGDGVYFFTWPQPKAMPRKMVVHYLHAESLHWSSWEQAPSSDASSAPAATPTSDPAAAAAAPDVLLPASRTAHALAAAGGRVYMWGGLVGTDPDAEDGAGGGAGEVLCWTPGGGGGAWGRLRMRAGTRAPAPRRGHRLFSLDGRHLLLTGGMEVASRRNAQEVWVLDVEAGAWYLVRAGPEPGPYLWEGASQCAVSPPLPGAPRLYAFGCEQHRHHWNGASCLHLHGLVDRQDQKTPQDHVQGRWQRVVLRSSCLLQWKSPCFSLGEYVMALDVPMGDAGICGTDDGDKALALWRLSSSTHFWDRRRVSAHSPPPIALHAVAVAHRKVLILGSKCNGVRNYERHLHVIDLAPSLQTLSACAMATHSVDPSPLPPALRTMVQRICTGDTRKL